MLTPEAMGESVTPVIAIVAEDLAVGTPTIGEPPLNGLVRRFISGRIKCVAHLEIRPPL
jgi:hypothetical protein